VRELRDVGAHLHDVAVRIDAEEHAVGLNAAGNVDRLARALRVDGRIVHVGAGDCCGGGFVHPCPGITVSAVHRVDRFRIIDGLRVQK
jgi:hypothetical protein